MRIDLASRLLEVREGDKLELGCEVTGYPPPAVQWTRQVAQVVVRGNTPVGTVGYQVDNRDTYMYMYYIYIWLLPEGICGQVATVDTTYKQVAEIQTGM